MPLLALLVESRHVAQYGSVYAIGIKCSPYLLIYIFSMPDLAKSKLIHQPRQRWPLPTVLDPSLEVTLSKPSDSRSLEPVAPSLTAQYTIAKHFFMVIYSHHCHQSNNRQNDQNMRWTLNRHWCGVWVSSTWYSVQSFSSSGDYISLKQRLLAFVVSPSTVPQKYSQHIINLPPKLFFSADQGNWNIV